MNPIRRLSRRIRAYFLRRKLQRAWREDADPVDIIHLELELQHLTQHESHNLQASSANRHETPPHQGASRKGAAPGK